MAKLNNTYKLFGRSIIAQRQVRNWSQKDLGDLVGLSQVTIHKIENGGQSCTLIQAIVLSRLLGIQLDKLPVNFQIKYIEDATDEAKP